MVKGTLVSIHICAGPAKPMVSVPEIRAVPGRGLEGDRYFSGTGTYSPKQPRPDSEVTLIEIEAFEALRRDYDIEAEVGDSRRNLVTRDVPLNHLVGREFQVGNVKLRGLRLCEPCGHLEELIGRPVRKGLIHRGGLRAQVLTEGAIKTGDPVQSA